MWCPSFVRYTDTYFAMVPLMAEGALYHGFVIEHGHPACTVDRYGFSSSNAIGVPSVICYWEHGETIVFQAAY